MKTFTSKQIEAVTLITACFPFIGTLKGKRNQLRQQHFKRKQDE
jgi:hypothetical protein